MHAGLCNSSKRQKHDFRYASEGLQEHLLRVQPRGHTRRHNDIAHTEAGAACRAARWRGERPPWSPAEMLASCASSSRATSRLSAQSDYFKAMKIALELFSVRRFSVGPPFTGRDTLVYPCKKLLIGDAILSLLTQSTQDALVKTELAPKTMLSAMPGPPSSQTSIKKE